MLISKKYAKKLVREGKATETTTVTSDPPGLVGIRYQALDRHDLQRVDHYRL